MSKQANPDPIVAAAEEIRNMCDDAPCSDEVAAIIRRHMGSLETIIAKLPKTADGVSMIPEVDTAWTTKEGHEVQKCAIWWDRACGDWVCGNEPMTRCYSTREAAITSACAAAVPSVESRGIQSGPVGRRERVTEIDLKAIKARAEAATPGPWCLNSTVAFGACFVWQEKRLGSPDAVIVCHLGSNDQSKWLTAMDQRNADGEFLTHARTDIPALVAEVERLQHRDQLDNAERLHAERDKLREQIKAAGQCKMFSQGDACDCTYCQQSHRLEKLAAELGEVKMECADRCEQVRQINAVAKDETRRAGLAEKQLTEARREIRRLNDELFERLQDAATIGALRAELSRSQIAVERLQTIRASCDPMNGDTPQWCVTCGAPMRAIRPGKAECDWCAERESLATKLDEAKKQLTEAKQSRAAAEQGFTRFMERTDHQIDELRNQCREWKRRTRDWWLAAKFSAKNRLEVESSLACSQAAIERLTKLYRREHKRRYEETPFSFRSTEYPDWEAKGEARIREARADVPQMTQTALAHSQDTMEKDEREAFERLADLVRYYAGVKTIDAVEKAIAACRSTATNDKEINHVQP